MSSRISRFPKKRAKKFARQKRQQKKIERKKPVRKNWIRHLLGATAYCSGKKKNFYARTYTQFFRDLETSLFNAIIDSTFKKCGNWSYTGYSAQNVPVDDIEEKYIYPSIQITGDI